MTKKKKKQTAAPVALNDKSYVAHGRARSLPLYKCLVNEGWQEQGIADIFVLRKHVNGHVTVGVYLIDTFCAGVKDTFYLFNISEKEFEEKILSMPVAREECPYELAHNIIYGAVAYAHEYGIEPHPDFKLTQRILEEDTEAIDLIELEFGRNGKPLLLINPAGDPRADYYLRQLEKNAGPGNYEVVDGRLEDEFDDIEDDYYAFPEDWDEKDWEEFIDETEPEELINYPQVASFIYDKISAKPTQAMKLLTIPTEVHGLQITYDALPGLPYNNTPEEIEETNAIMTLLQSEDVEEAVLAQLPDRLQRDMERWPQNPMLYSRLVMVYEMLDEEEKAAETARLQYEKFPDYLFAKVLHAEQLVEQGRLDEVPAVFGGHYSLAAIYPQRASFHIGEVVAFHAFMCLYFLEKEDIFSANIHQNILLANDILEDMPFNFLVLIRLNIAIAKEMEPVLEAAQQSEEKKKELIAQLVH